MKRADFRFLDPLRVRWAEVDLQQVVFNGHYLMYLDTAVAGWWRALALPYQETLASLQGDFFVRKATLEYEAAARYDDLLEIGIRCAGFGTSSMRLAGAVFRGGRRLVHGELVYVWVDAATRTSRPLPPSLRALIEAHEAGDAMFSLRRGGWDELRPWVEPLRRAVIVGEQHGAPERVADADDEGAIHVLAVNRYGLALASGRLLVAAPGVGEIGRIVTRADMRGTGFGRAVLEALLEAARERGDHEVRVHARADALPFYERCGFVRAGADFVAEGLPHVELRRRP